MTQETKEVSVSDNKTPAELRDFADRETKRANDAEAALGASQGKLRTYEAADFFEQAGYDKAQAKLYAQSDGDLSVEGALEFAQEFNLTQVEQKREPLNQGDGSQKLPGQVQEPAAQAQAPNPGAAAFSAAGAQGGGEPVQNSSGEKEMVDYMDFLKIQVENPQEAAKILSEGRLALSPENNSPEAQKLRALAQS